MNEVERADLLKALGPTVKSYRKGGQILKEYWRDKQAIIWTVEQVHRAANERERVFTSAEARELLRDLTHHHNPQYGIKWQDLLQSIDQSVLGRKITKRELRAFIEQDRVCIQRRTT